MARKRKGAEEVSKGALNMRRLRASNPIKAGENRKRAMRKLRLECLRQYSDGDPRCRCCGEAAIEFLHIDHGFGDGAEHRRKLGAFGVNGGAGFYCWLKRSGWPKDIGLQVLCSNCDFGKKDRKYCPHELKLGVAINGSHIPKDHYPITIDAVPRKSRSGRLDGETVKEYQKRYKIEHRERVGAIKKRAQDAVRLECLRRYSGLSVPECHCCKESMVQFLQLDHIDGDGAEQKHRLLRETGANMFGGTFFYWLRRNNFPEWVRLQVLCVNCNFAKRTGKYCPHELKRGTDMHGNVISAEYYPQEEPITPIHRGPERESWLKSPAGLAYIEKQAAAKRGNKYKTNTTVDVPCTGCGTSIKRRKSVLEKSQNKDGAPRFFCTQKCAGAWKSKNLIGDKVYNYKHNALRSQVPIQSGVP